MPLPDFNNSGDLPPGVYTASIDEVNARFRKATHRRQILATRIKRAYQLALETGFLTRFVIFGSFLTDKCDPNNFDVLMIMDNAFEVASLTGESRLLFEHSAAQDHFGCSVFWIREMAALGGEEAAIADWQIKRDGSRRGIIDVKENTL